MTTNSSWFWPHLGLVTAVLVLSFVVRIRLADVPLERDEGEHAYAAQMMLGGNAPWKAAYNMKLPGTDALYALWLALFGQTAVAIRVGLLLVNTATIILITALGRRLFGMAGGAVAGASYGILSLSQNVLGTIAHSTHYVVLFAVLGTLILLRAGLRPWPVFASGIVYGLAFLMKQPGIFFAAFGTAYLAWLCGWTRTAPARFAVFLSGVALPYGLLCLFLWRAEAFARFWFWTVTLAGAYAGQFSLADLFDGTKDSFPVIVAPNIFLWILAGAGLMLACARRTTRGAGLITGAFLAFSILAVVAGGAFEPHYFILMLPAVALAAGAGAAGSGWRLPVLCLAAICVYSVARERNYLFRMTPYEFARDTWGANPFPEAEKAAEYIRLHSDPGARIAVLGSEAEIYFYARRRSATGYLFTYGLMDANDYARPMQAEMISEIRTARPEYIVLVNVASSWLIAPESSKNIFAWADGYTSAFYKKVGVIDIPQEGDSKYVWGDEAGEYQPSGSDYLLVYRAR